ncbi:DMT family transporter [Celeribacter persicus]|jgi:Predicted permease, DMT superfamily|uniref:Threonine/homoserine efflux transporter RhtA n=1 Tax=Celeribacter persicus TaxID=1651082 RepID=A0A2T5HV67_9RHOB|nr:DMT family transporter [Celeribacter persicus]PTQ75476.1 threonine/homoserine efflux transporter RhtA [Celeribacter persicus]
MAQNHIRGAEWLRISGLLALTLIAFAGNSLLTRAALTDPATGALAFAGVRLVSGALVLLGLGMIRGESFVPQTRDLPAILALFCYAVAFSLSYRAMSAASGALILFAVVQVTMLFVASVRGVRIGAFGLIGVAMALSGLIWLLLPGLEAPPLPAAVMMALSGMAWGIYSLLGQGAGAQAGRTTRNFIGTVPFVLVVFLIVPPHLSAFGWLMAVLSGGVTSALGYMLWYRVLPHLSAPLAASAQLSVPLITALGGLVFLGEGLGLRFLFASVLILGGIYLTGKRRL